MPEKKQFYYIVVSANADSQKVVSDSMFSQKVVSASVDHYTRGRKRQISCQPEGRKRPYVVTMCTQTYRTPQHDAVLRAVKLPNA